VRIRFLGADRQVHGIPAADAIRELAEIVLLDAAQLPEEDALN
jgi:hypothetical protein